METFERLLKKTKETIQFQTGLGIIRWDLQTQMPPKGMKQRSDQLALMSKLLHRMFADEELQNIVTTLEKDIDSLDSVQKREVELVRRLLDRRSGITEELAAQQSVQRTVATAAWKRAKETNNWKLFESELVPLVEISKEVSEIMMEGSGAKCKLDTQMDIWEPRMTTASIISVFNSLRKRLVPLVKKYSAACQDVRIDFKNRKVTKPIQRKVVTNLTGIMGYDTTSDNAGGRIDEAEHPFTTGYYDDVRFTINISEDDVFRAMFGGLHEAGHAIHNQNQNPEWKWMHLGKSCSSGISESQSRFMENIIGRSPEFWEFYYPKFLDHTSEVFKDVSQEELLQMINLVEPSKIRVLADEMTYALHIIIRFEIEQDLFDDKIVVSEIPAIWNDKHEDYLGVEIETDTEGALQDVHWAWAYWGYFPTYALGNLYAAMIREKLTSEIPEWTTHVANGNIASPVQWLIENVHKKSNICNPTEMIKEITGKSLTADPFIDYLDKKYSALFG